MSGLVLFVLSMLSVSFVSLATVVTTYRLEARSAEAARAATRSCQTSTACTAFRPQLQQLQPGVLLHISCQAPKWMLQPRLQAVQIMRRDTQKDRNISICISSSYSIYVYFSHIVHHCSLLFTGQRWSALACALYTDHQASRAHKTLHLTISDASHRRKTGEQNDGRLRKSDSRECSAPRYQDTQVYPSVFSEFLIVSRFFGRKSQA
jgi:hypothetical protein